MTTSEAVQTEQYQHHGWPIRVTCEFQAAEGKFAAQSFVTPGGQRERATPGPAVLEPLAIEAKEQALKAAKRYIDKFLID